MQTLAEIRQQIDKIDEEIQTLIMKRAELAIQVANAKRGEEKNPVFYRPEREAEVLQRVIQRNKNGRLPNAVLTRLFKEIMSACLALQNPLKIAFLGPIGTYSQAATLKYFGHEINQLAVQTIDDVFHQVETGIAHYGVVPVENSTEGSVNQTLDRFVSTSLKICGEVNLAIHHNLLSKATQLDEIKKIYAHPQSLAQCRIWLNTHLPQAERITVNSNAEAAVSVSQQLDSAAIAGLTAAEIYQLNIIANHIEDYVNNTTRFAILGHQAVAPTGKDKTSLLLATNNSAGALYQLLYPFAENEVSMTRIESRPSRQGIWEYVFFIDFEGHIEDSAVKKAMQTLAERASLIKHLGSYPQAFV